MMAKPMKALELHYPMIQGLIVIIVIVEPPIGNTVNGTKVLKTIPLQ